MPDLDLGSVVGPQGPQGVPGAPGATGETGAQGVPGPAGESAKINGVNALTLTAKDGLKGTQSGNTFTLTAPDLNADCAGAHNAIFRGKFLGNSVTSEQYAQIAAGTFKDLYIGDYWTIGGVNYRIAAFDYYLRCGDTECTQHHVTLVPDSTLYNAPMNSSHTTAGGYVGSKMYVEGLAQAKTTIKAAFNGHVLNHRIYLVNAVSNGAPSGGLWCDSEVDLMTERMVYGCPIFSPMPNGALDPWTQMHNYTVEKSQLPLFALAPQYMIYRAAWYWLRDVVTAADFANVYYHGNAGYNGAGYSVGVRPAFSII